jgi:hypothetical protein
MTNSVFSWIQTPCIGGLHASPEAFSVKVQSAPDLWQRRTRLLRQPASGTSAPSTSDAGSAGRGLYLFTLSSEGKPARIWSPPDLSSFHATYIKLHALLNVKGWFCPASWKLFE